MTGVGSWHDGSQLAQFYITGMAKHLKATPALDLVEDLVERHLETCSAQLDLLENGDLLFCGSPEDPCLEEYSIERVNVSTTLFLIMLILKEHRYRSTAHLFFSLSSIISPWPKSK